MNQISEWRASVTRGSFFREDGSGSKLGVSGIQRLASPRAVLTAVALRTLCMASMFLERLVQDENGKKQHSSAHEGTETKAPIRLPRKNQKRTPPETLKRL